MNKRCLIATVALLGWMLFGMSAGAADLQHLKDAQLIDNPGNDGDSFLVRHGDQEFRLRLYFVDTPESSASWESDVRRVREQKRYFGLPDEAQVLAYGKQATAFTRKQLDQPFEVYTAFASALGRDPGGRVYGFVTTADGKDLGRLLIQNGLARTYGVGRETPDGVHRDEWKARLADREASAMLKNVGIWEAADSDKIEEMRAQQRAEDQEMKKIRSGINSDSQQTPAEKIDLNHCTAQQLQSVKGIGPALARRIMEGRPYKSIDDITNVKGISTTMLGQWQDQLVVTP
jgi:DNA uptake protein ComE-like DNA-binding protein